MIFPAFVYKRGGPHFAKGGTYRYAHVEDASAYAEKLAEGWFPSAAEAIAGKVAETVKISDNVPNAAPKPSRGRPKRVKG